MTAAMKALSVAFTSDDERPCTHRSGANAQLVFTRTDRTFAGHSHFCVEVYFSCHVVVMAVHRQLGSLETGQALILMQDP